MTAADVYHYHGPNWLQILLIVIATVIVLRLLERVL